MSAIFVNLTVADRVGNVVASGLRRAWKFRKPILAYVLVSYACLFAYLLMYGFPDDAVTGLFEKRQDSGDDGLLLVPFEARDWSDGQWDAAAEFIMDSSAIDAYFRAQPGWGGWGTDRAKVTSLLSKCYRQERTAMLLNLFLGCLGIDQWYAHHWALAVFKMLTLGGAGIWALVDMILWIVGGVYGTPGCGGTWRH